MKDDRPLLGIVLMLGFCALAPVGDAIAKLIGDAVPILVVLLARFGIQAIVLSPALIDRFSRPALTRDLLGLMVLRTLLHMLGIGLMFAALRLMPLADAVAIAFVLPFLLLILDHTLLGEVIGPRRFLACGVGFLGTLLIIQPSFAVIGFAALLPLGVAFVFAFFMMLTRRIAREVEPIALQAISGWIALVLVAPFLLWGSDPPLAYLSGPGAERLTWLLIGLGLIGTAAHLLMSWSLRFAPASTLAPMQYLEIPFATLLGYLLFQEIPNSGALIGILITIAAGLYVIQVERANLPARAPKAVRPIPATDTAAE